MEKNILEIMHKFSIAMWQNEKKKYCGSETPPMAGTLMIFKMSFKFP